MQIIKNTKLLVGENASRFGSFLATIRDCMVGTEHLPKGTVVQVIRIHDESKAEIEFILFGMVHRQICHISSEPYRFRLAYKNEEENHKEFFAVKADWTLSQL